MGFSQADARARGLEALTSLHIGDLGARSINQLSFGQRKLVAIAGVLAMRPSVLLLDEPTAGLDHQATRKLIALLEMFSSANHAILISTHDIFLAESWANSVSVLERGTTVFSGRPDTLLGDPNLLIRAGLPTDRIGQARSESVLRQHRLPRKRPEYSPAPPPDDS
jgi:cobalt/nickel transport system ATP-binding protein